MTGRSRLPSDASPGRNDRRIRSSAICAALAVIAFLAFRGVLSHPFVNYDVSENAHVQKGL